MTKFNCSSVAQATALLITTTLVPIGAQATSITVDAAIRGTANGTFIETGDGLSITPTLSTPQVSISDSVSVNGYTFDYLATSNIQTGTLRLLTSASSDDTSSGSATASGLGMPQAIAQMQEDLVFTPSDNNPYTITLSYAYNGVFVEDPSSDTYADASLYYWGDGGISDVLFAELTPTGQTNEVMQVDLVLQGQTSIGFQAGLEAFIFSIDGGGHSTYADFSHTASVSVAIPDGVNMTSSSGLFLTAVPLPASLPLFISALACLGAIGRRRRQSC